MTTDPIKLFLSCSQKNDRYLQELFTHLATLHRRGLIAHWHRRQIAAGEDVSATINRQLNEADIIIIAVSPDLLASDVFHDTELKPSLARHHKQAARVVPLLLRPADWRSTELGSLQPLPKDGTPVCKSKNRDETWLEVLRGIEEIIEDFRQSSNAAAPPEPSPPSPDSSGVAAPRDARASVLSSTAEHWAPRSIRAFESRMSRAFPGVRGLQKYTSGKEIVSRLTRFFEAPAIDSEREHGLAWWFRGRTNNGIERVRQISDSKILIDDIELVPETLVVYRDASPWYQLIYLRAAGEPPARPHDAPKVPKRARKIVREEYALFDGHPISITESDDGAAEINGKLVDVQFSERRTRCLTPYNLLIAPQGTPLNDGPLDATVARWMDDLLRSPARVDAFLTDFFAKLPRKYFL